MGTNRIIAMVELTRIRAAAERARPYVLRTPMVPVEGALLKLECLQPTGSFKVRGFFAAATQAQISMPERVRHGLITVSAGNAAQACAYAAHSLGVPCRVVMFDTAPPITLEGVRRWGGTPMLMPRTALLDWLGSRGWDCQPEAFLHPFAATEAIAAHGSVDTALV